MSDHIMAKLGASQNKHSWGKLWVGEMIADAFGVLLGGPGFVGSLVRMLFKTKEEVVEASGTGAHPNSYVRIFLLAALLRRTGVEDLNALADKVEADWEILYEPAPQWSSFVGECDEVSDVLLAEPLEALRQHCLLDFARNNREFKNAPDLKKDHEYIKAIASHLTGINTSDYEGAISVPESLIRLVPAAAQLAMQSVNTDHKNQFAALHKDAIELMMELQQKANVEFLADDLQEHEQYLDELIEQLDFSVIRMETN
jgi:hypothetical protein